MASLLEDLATKFESFDLMMKKVLDKVTGLEAWKSSTDASMDSLLSKANNTAAAAAGPLPHQPSLPPPPPPAWTDPFDLNLAPGQAARSSTPTLERPSRHCSDHGHRDVGGRILGSHPPRPVMGMPHNPSPRFHDLIPKLSSSAVRSDPTPKMDFPKFDNTNPKLWKDKCELFFEVYGVSESLKPCFAALSFSGTAESWLQTFERRGRVRSWEELHKAMCEHFDRDQYSFLAYAPIRFTVSNCIG
ncbi:hypothetical protein GQ55_8G101800 [Panicum hallii var. hallii]|uniref:Retrotransposon gag domain-containing protein n=1 Tax=Panicum hallii var. hallii TaxID=1504633 RepID=A0A2T7CMA3_9POAL|nr:hypothetical protein GQ55_8G101800 [Panicum hallii var. hallii]